MYATLSPICSYFSTYKHNDYPNCSVGYGNWPNGSRPLVGLTSFPRSGNTWTRHLIETATGIHTGSLYNANGLYNGGFTAEFDDPSLGRAVVYKAHGYADIFESGILLIRNPYDSFVSFYLFHTKGFMANPPLEEVFKDNKNWTNFVKRQHVRWPRIVENWFESGKRVLIVHYEDLVANTIYHLRRMLEFQNITLTPDRLKCLNDDLEGRFHRQHSENFHFDPYNEELHHIIDADIQKVNSLLKSRNEPPVHKAAYDVEL
ncbi:sialate:O-sulfotransferase 2-like [Saccoglossus kowalevskii]|uniref:WSC domain-containing protein 2-like n=1 Tax=Saccoglossus kowalevskii TaxID=10224 RepID=A0ABM0M3X8_SACKO|nr:PREDICTED: WSC domain-containing protein 2-like [Saccoglossus kowalevskii]